MLHNNSLGCKEAFVKCKYATSVPQILHPASPKLNSKKEVEHLCRACTPKCRVIVRRRGFPCKHACSLQRRPSLVFDFRTFACAKDQASSSHNGLLRKTRHHAFMICLYSRNEGISRFHREQLTFPYHDLSVAKYSSNASPTRALPTLVQMGKLKCMLVQDPPPTPKNRLYFFGLVNPTPPFLCL